MPDVQVQARANRAFMHRAVRYLADAGVRQFLDIGSGIPTVGNVHEIAQRVAPESHVVYVDIDEVAVAHSEQILAGNAGATVIHEDARRPEAILGHLRVRAMLDFDRPVALLMVAVLHAIPDDDDPAGIVARLAAPLCAGSHLVIGHATDEIRPDEIGQLAALSRQTTTPFTLRGRERIERLFAGFDLLPPGVVWAPQWRPGSTGEVGEHPEDSSNLVGVGHRT